MVNIAVLVSGGGTNLQALIDAEQDGKIKNGKIALVISSKDGAYALERAKNHDIPSLVIAKKNCKTPEELEEKILAALEKYEIGLVVLAGYLSILGEKIIRAYEKKIINVHPSLIPAFCGAGFYGLRVHEAALSYGVKVTGATVHFVSEVVDGGPIILQKAVNIRKKDTPESLQKRVMKEAEHKLLPKAVSLFCEGKLSEKKERKHS